MCKSGECDSQELSLTLTPTSPHPTSPAPPPSFTSYGYTLDARAPSRSLTRSR